MKPNLKVLTLCGAVVALGAMSSQAQVVLGSFQGPSDPTDAGWVNPLTGNPITTDPADSFVAAGVAGYPLSLGISQTAGSFGNPSLELQFSASQIAAFNANNYLTFTFSQPAATPSTTGGYSQVYNLAFNSGPFGYNNIASGGGTPPWSIATETGNTAFTPTGTAPNFYFFPGSPMETMEVTVNYSSFLSAIEGMSGEGYLQMTFQDNLGGGAVPIQYFNNVELSVNAFGTPEPSTTALLGLGLLGGAVLMFRRRKLA